MMLKLFIASAGRLLQLVRLSVSAPPAAGGLAATQATARPSLRRQLLMLGFLPLFALAQAIHWLGFLLDELLFPGYRRVVVREPLFVLGVPRSGTTHLHRVLAQDEQFTTFSTWECLFALSVTERRFWLAVASLDARIGRPLGRGIDRIQDRLFGALNEIHSMRLDAPEEDYFALTPVLACFILVLPFPNLGFLWQMGNFDRDMPARERQRLLDYYRSCLQRHLFVHGPEKRLLSKNAAFAPLAHGLRETFPDARFVVCLREPAATLPSQLSSIADGRRFFEVDSLVPDFSDRLSDQLAFYYANLDQALHSLPAERCAWVTMNALGTDLAESVGVIYAQLGFDVSDTFGERLADLAPKAGGYRSSHRYSLDGEGLCPHRIEQELGGLYRRMAARCVSLRPHRGAGWPEHRPGTDSLTHGGGQGSLAGALPC